MQGFAPAGQVPFVSAKVPKTISARAQPQECPSVSIPNQDGSGTRFEVQSYLSTQTTRAQEVDSEQRFRRTQGGAREACGIFFLPNSQPKI